MRVVWKYGLPLSGRSRLEIPVGAIVRSVGAQGQALVVWIEVDPGEKSTEEVRLLSVLTGEAFVGENARFIGTALFEGGAFIAHVYQEGG
jgi:hypothetical protein